MTRSAPQITSVAMLTHFTRASPSADALDNLVGILRGGVIRGSGRMVHGRRRVVCFFDAPLRELGALLTRGNRYRYEPFGVALDKRYAFRMGVRPVIYMPRREAERMVAADELWRVVDLDLERTPPTDWTLEREWRGLDHVPLPPHGAVALVESWRDVR